MVIEITVMVVRQLHTKFLTMMGLKLNTISIEENLRGPRTNREKAYKGGAQVNYNMGPYSNVRSDTEKLQKRTYARICRDDMFLNELESNRECQITMQCSVVKPKFINPMGGESHPELSKIYKPG